MKIIFLDWIVILCRLLIHLTSLFPFLRRRHVVIAKSEMVFEAQTRVPGNEDKKHAAKESFHGVGLKVVADDEAVRCLIYLVLYTAEFL